MEGIAAEWWWYAVCSGGPSLYSEAPYVCGDDSWGGRREGLGCIDVDNAILLAVIICGAMLIFLIQWQWSHQSLSFVTPIMVVERSQSGFTVPSSKTLFLQKLQCTALGFLALLLLLLLCWAAATCCAA